MSNNPLAALAMRERAAEVAINACLVPPDGGNPTEYERLVCIEASQRIRALPTTFTDAELLAAAMQLPEVRALAEAAIPFSQAIIRNGIPTAGSIGRTDVTNIRAALAPFMKGAS